MTCYCPACGFKNAYAGVKPPSCQSCDEPLEPKPVAKAAKRPRYEEPEEEIVESTPDFDADAIRASIRLEADEHEGFMTIEALAKTPGGGGRGAPPVDAGLRDETIKTLMGGQPGAPAFTPPPDDKPRSGARRTGRLSR